MATLNEQNALNCAKNPAHVNAFFNVLDAPLSTMARDLGLNLHYIEGLSAFESGWYDAHNRGLCNPFGLTKAGGNNLHFSSVREAIAYWLTIYADQVKGAKTPLDFAKRLEGVSNGVAVRGWHKYNSVNLVWEQKLVEQIRTVETRRGIWLSCPKA